jgi:hypothetical protein
VDPRSLTPASQEHRSLMPGQVELAMPPSTRPDIDYDHEEDVPLRFWRIDNVLGPTAVPGLVAHVV